MMRFGEIETFRALMRTGTTRRAADLLALTQPAISQSLRRLEQQSGLQLFQRVRGRLIPTPEAHALMHEVERSFVGMDAIEHRLRSLRDHGTGQLELCCYPALGLGFVPRALALWQHAGARNAMPHVSLQILSSREVREQAARGLCEVGLMADEMPLHGIEHSTFADWPGVLVMASGHPLARQKLVKPSQLQEVRFIALNPEDASRQRLQAALLREGIHFGR